MTVRRRKSLLLLAAAVCVAGVVAVVGFGLGVRAQVTPPPPSESLRNAPIAPAASRDAAERGDEPAVSLQRLRRVASLDLRRPLFEPDEPPAQAAAREAASRAPALSIELLGTINEPGHSYAIVSYPGSPWELRGVGERFDTPAGSVTIVEITPRRVTCRHRGEQRRLEMPEPEVPRP